MKHSVLVMCLLSSLLLVSAAQAATLTANTSKVTKTLIDDFYGVNGFGWLGDGLQLNNGSAWSGVSNSSYNMEKWLNRSNGGNGLWRMDANLGCFDITANQSWSTDTTDATCYMRAIVGTIKNITDHGGRISLTFIYNPRYLVTANSSCVANASESFSNKSCALTGANRALGAQMAWNWILNATENNLTRLQAIYQIEKYNEPYGTFYLRNTTALNAKQFKAFVALNEWQGWVPELRRLANTTKNMSLRIGIGGCSYSSGTGSGSDTFCDSFIGNASLYTGNQTMDFVGAHEYGTWNLVSRIDTFMTRAKAAGWNGNVSFTEYNAFATVQDAYSLAAAQAYMASHYTTIDSMIKYKMTASRKVNDTNNDDTPNNFMDFSPPYLDNYTWNVQYMATNFSRAISDGQVYNVTGETSQLFSTLQRHNNASWNLFILSNTSQAVNLSGFSNFTRIKDINNQTTFTITNGNTSLGTLSGNWYIYELTLGPAISFNTTTPTTTPSIVEPENLTFNYTLNNLNSSSVTTEWRLNGTIVGTSGDYTFEGNYSSAGTWTINLTVSDGTTSLVYNWTLTVNNTIRNISFNTTAPTTPVTITNGTTQMFSYTIINPDSTSTNSSWTINGTHQNGCSNNINCSWNFSLPYGLYYMNTTVNASGANSVNYSWVVTFQQQPAPITIEAFNSRNNTRLLSFKANVTQASTLVFFQETATKATTEGGLSNGSYSYSGSYFYSYYAKPTYTVGAIWQVKHGNSSQSLYNITIPSACWDEDPGLLRLRFYSFKSFGAGNSESTPQCYNTSAEWMSVGTNMSDNSGGSPGGSAISNTTYDENYTTTGFYAASASQWLIISGSQSINANVYEEGVWWNQTTTTPVIVSYETTNGTIYLSDIGQGQTLANITVYDAQHYFDNTTIKDINLSITNNITSTLVPYTEIRAFNQSSQTIYNFTIEYSGSGTAGSVTTTNGVAYAPLFNGTYEVNLTSAYNGNINYTAQSVNLTPNPYLQSYNFTSSSYANTFLIYFYDEINNTLITGINISAYVTGNLYSYNFTTTTGVVNQSFVYPGSYIITATAPGYDQRQQYAVLVNESVVTVIFYMLPVSYSDLVLTTVYNTNSRKVSDALIYMQKKNLSGTNYYTVESCWTNSLGQCLLRAELYDTTYKFLIYYGGVLKFNSNDTQISSTSINFIIDTGGNAINQVINNAQIRGSVTNNTGYFYFSYDDRSGTIQSACLEVSRRVGSATTINSTTCSTNTTGVLSAPYYDSLNDEWIGKGYVITSGGTQQVIDVASVVTSAWKTVFGRTGLYYFGFLLLGTMIFAGLFHPAAALLMAGVGVFVMNALGFISVGMAASISLFILVAIYIVVVKKS